jgi:hypothetical protein
MLLSLRHPEPCAATLQTKQQPLRWKLLAEIHVVAWWFSVDTRQCSRFGALRSEGNVTKNGRLAKIQDGHF